MPRIRSIHPGFWTDEAVASVSVTARLFFIGIWNHCDDKGVFEWKPVSLRLRIFPADQIDVVSLLDELGNADLIRWFEVAGRAYGIVRNFATFQRPKKPNSLYPLPIELRVFSGLSENGAVPVRNQFGNRESEGVGVGVPPNIPPSDSSPEIIPPGSRPPKQSRGKRQGWTVLAGGIRT